MRSFGAPPTTVRPKKPGNSLNYDNDASFYFSITCLSIY